MFFSLLIVLFRSENTVLWLVTFWQLIHSTKHTKHSVQRKGGKLKLATTMFHLSKTIIILILL